MQDDTIAFPTIPQDSARIHCVECDGLPPQMVNVLGWIDDTWRRCYWVTHENMIRWLVEYPNFGPLSNREPQYWREMPAPPQEEQCRQSG